VSAAAAPAEHWGHRNVPVQTSIDSSISQRQLAIRRAKRYMSRKKGLDIKNQKARGMGDYWEDRVKG
jgi:hypothetical protein